MGLGLRVEDCSRAEALEPVLCSWVRKLRHLGVPVTLRVPRISIRFLTPRMAPTLGHLEPQSPRIIRFRDLGFRV